MNELNEEVNALELLRLEDNLSPYGVGRLEALHDVKQWIEAAEVTKSAIT